jgi:hypothetical protein
MNSTNRQQPDVKPTSTRISAKSCPSQTRISDTAYPTYRVRSPCGPPVTRWVPNTLKNTANSPPAPNL